MIKETFSPEETFAFGEELGKNARPGQVYTLIGDLGVGKTVLTQGIAKGLGIDEAICSPTFTIVQEYHTGVCLFTILMCIVSGVWKRWTRSGLTITSMARA